MSSGVRRGSVGGGLGARIQNLEDPARAPGAGAGAVPRQEGSHAAPLPGAGHRGRAQLLPFLLMPHNHNRVVTICRVVCHMKLFIASF